MTKLVFTLNSILAFLIEIILERLNNAVLSFTSSFSIFYEMDHVQYASKSY